MISTTHSLALRRDLLWRAALLTILVFLPLSGCSSGPQHPVAPEQAKQTLEKVLNGWKEGKPADTWRKEKPEIVVQDFDWTTGKKLTSFEILGDGKAVDAVLHCEVKLVLDDAGQSKTKTVTYLVGTSPVLTVFRGFGS